MLNLKFLFWFNKVAEEVYGAETWCYEIRDDISLKVLSEGQNDNSALCMMKALAELKRIYLEKAATKKGK